MNVCQPPRDTVTSYHRRDDYVQEGLQLQGYSPLILNLMMCFCVVLSLVFYEKWTKMHFLAFSKFVLKLQLYLKRWLIVVLYSWQCCSHGSIYLFLVLFPDFDRFSDLLAFHLPDTKGHNEKWHITKRKSGQCSSSYVNCSKWKHSFQREGNKIKNYIKKKKIDSDILCADKKPFWQVLPKQESLKVSSLIFLCW